MDQSLGSLTARLDKDSDPASEVNIVALENRRDVRAGRVLGQLVELDGLHAVIASRMGTGGNGVYWSVGHLITIVHGDVRIVGVVCTLAAAERRWNDTETNVVHVRVELSGEIADDADGKPRFRRGLQSYPALGAIAHLIRAADLAAIYAFRGNDGVEIGHLCQNEKIPATISVGQMVRRHFAVLGSTGVGKTTAVSILIQKSIEARKNLRILIMDPHNEYKRHFPDNSLVFDATNLDLPFWMFRFDELADIVFSGRDPSPDEREALLELVKAAKTKFTTTPTSPIAVRRAAPASGSAASADTPVPYRMSDAFQIIEEWIGQLEPRYRRGDLRILKHRLETLNRDPRFKFMFGMTGMEDSMASILSRLFRMPINGAPVSIVQLAGLPNEVLNSVVSVLARIAFDVAQWSEGAYEVAVVCEEAHRYIPNNPALGFAPTRQAIGRIAKEGRKYGASLCVVSQRPVELDATVLSQCSTVFAMRLPNEGDKAIIKSALGESSATMLDFLSSIADREAIAFGEAIPTPMRMKFSRPATIGWQEAQTVEPHRDPAANGCDVLRIVSRLRCDAT
ncbi:MAG: ATP-binding protein [Roseiarcus sp.]